VKVVFVDGHCLICNRLVELILKHDKSKEIHIAHLQGEYAKANLPEEYTKQLHSVVFIDDGNLLEKSDAALKVISYFGGIWKLLLVLKIIPKLFRDIIYMWISKNRYNLGDKLEACPLPPKDSRDRFL
jgi:predicted DCC family thiol-disulfide oxidoreductase YuxK